MLERLLSSRLTREFSIDHPVQLINKSRLRDSQWVAFRFVSHQAPIDPETRVSIELLQEVSNRTIRQGRWSDTYCLFATLDQKAVLKAIRWVHGQADQAWWDQMNAEMMVQMWMLASLFKIPTLEQLAITYLDFTFVAAGFCPSDGFMRWMWEIEPTAPYVRRYLLQVCYYHFVHRGRSAENFGDVSWNQRLAVRESWIGEFRVLIREMAGERWAWVADDYYCANTDTNTFSHFVGLAHDTAVSLLKEAPLPVVERSIVDANRKRPSGPLM